MTGTPIIVNEPPDETRSEAPLTEVFDKHGNPAGYLTTNLDEARRGAASKKFSDPFVVVFLPGLQKIISDVRVRTAHYRILMAVLEASERDGREWPANIAEIAQRTGIAYTRVSSSISDLAEWGYLQRPRRGVLKLDPRFAWKGSAKVREGLL